MPGFITESTYNGGMDEVGSPTSSGRAAPVKCPASHSYALRTSSTTGACLLPLLLPPADSPSSEGPCREAAAPRVLLSRLPEEAGATASRSMACHALGLSGVALA